MSSSSEERVSNKDKWCLQIFVVKPVLRYVVSKKMLSDIYEYIDCFLTLHLKEFEDINPLLNMRKLKWE